MSRFLLITALALTACRERGLTALSADLTVPTELDFGVVYVGHARTQSLEISNRGRAPVEFHVLVSAPFAAPSQLRVPGGMSATLDVQLTAESEGPVSGSLELEADGLAFDVALTAVGALAPRCLPSNDCVESHFDPASGCVELAMNEGARCGANDLCITGGQCQQGACLGEAISCDDGNACTSDACSPAQGCLHPPVKCAQPTAACEVAVCEPSLGCGVQPASDGMRCGANDCQTAHVCIAGACELRPAPDGSECGEATTCRGPGSCSSGACLPAPAQVPTPRWRFTPSSDMNVMRAVVDTHGNTFALVGTNMIYRVDGGMPPPYPLWLYSFDADGHRRFAVDLSQQTPGLENGVALMADPDADRVYLAARTYNYGTSVPHRVVVAQARHSVTGALLWESDLHQGISVSNSSNGEMQLDVTRMMLLEPGKLALSVVEGESLHQAYVVTLSTGSGAQLWKTQRSGHMRSGASANGEVWENSAACWSSDTWVSHISPTGVSSSQRLLAVSMLAFDQDRALVRVSGNAEVSWLSSSLVLTPLPLPGRHIQMWASAARIEGPSLTLSTQDSQSQYLDRYDSTTGTWLWSAPFGPSTTGVSQVWLLRDGGTASAVSFADGGNGLVTHAGTGEEVESCPYGTASGIDVSNELYVTQDGASIVTFDLPGRQAATSGWSGPNGFAGTGRAR